MILQNEKVNAFHKQFGIKDNNSEQLREFLSENNILTEYVKLYTSNISDVENLPKKLLVY